MQQILKSMAKKYEPTAEHRRMVLAMAGCGITQDDIARVIVPGGMHDETLRKHFREELDIGLTKANARVAELLFQQIEGGNATAMMFWLKCRAGWRETAVLEHAGNAPVHFSINFVTPETRSAAEVIDQRAAEDCRAISGGNVAVLGARKV